MLNARSTAALLPARLLAALSPYQTEHINRFRTYELNFDPTPEPLKPELHIPRKLIWLIRDTKAVPTNRAYIK